MSRDNSWTRDNSQPRGWAARSSWKQPRSWEAPREGGLWVSLQVQGQEALEQVVPLPPPPRPVSWTLP